MHHFYHIIEKRSTLELCKKKMIQCRSSKAMCAVSIGSVTKTLQMKDESHGCMISK